MEMISYNCPNCDSSNFTIDKDVYICKNCLSKFGKKQLDSAMFVDLRQANNFRQMASFEKAKRIYEQILKNYANENLTDVYWGLFLCEQKVIFEQDGKGQMFPSFYSLVEDDKPLEDNDYFNKAIGYAFKHEKSKVAVFGDLGEKIEYAKKMYKDIQAKTKPYDVFICFKKSDEKGKETYDTKLAYEIYRELSSKHNVFFSEESLKYLKTSYRDYEPNIYYGLYTAKIMLLICTKNDYINSQWLKNEWSRFTKINSDEKHIIPIFANGYSPSKLPEELWHKQGYFADIKLIANLKTELNSILNPVDEISELKKQLEELKKINAKVKEDSQSKKIDEFSELKKQLEEIKNQKLKEESQNKTVDEISELKKQLEELKKEKSKEESQSKQFDEISELKKQLEELKDSKTKGNNKNKNAEKLPEVKKKVDDNKKENNKLSENEKIDNSSNAKNFDEAKTLNSKEIESNKDKEIPNTNIQKVEDNKEIETISNFEINEAYIEKFGYQRSKNNIYFGSYPQTRVTNKFLCTILEKLVKDVPTKYDYGNWKDYNYFSKRDRKSYMFYKDVTYNGEKYRGVYFFEYRPQYTFSDSVAENSIQYKNKYYTNTLYWFKFEPLSWSIVNESSGNLTIVSNIALDSQELYYTYDGAVINGKTIYKNNYKYSLIRNWLNKYFYETAFNELQRKFILLTNLDNSLISTGDEKNSNICENFDEKIFLLSNKEAFNDFLKTDDSRKRMGSDYAKCQGLTINDTNCAIWWLRSPVYINSVDMQAVTRDGLKSKYSTSVTYSYFGIVPAMRIKLINN